MRPGLRLILFLVAVAVLAWPVWRIAQALPAFGSPTGAYGPAVNAIGPKARNVSNVVSAVNFDFRAVDTVGEEFMLLGAVTGSVLLLRGSRGEDVGAEAPSMPGRAFERRSEAVILTCRLFGPLIVLFGVYMALHGSVTPGGGFQGGVVIASGLLLAWLGEGYRGWRRLVRSRVLDALEGGGALLFVLAGLWPMLQGGAYLENTLPLGRFRNFLSGGLILVENAGVALAVLGGFSMLFLEFMEETRAMGREGQG